MITEQEQEILDNTPDDATQHKKIAGIYGSGVVDAVNYHEGVWPYVNRSEILAVGWVICNEEAFNQCVKEMSEHNGDAHFHMYSISIKALLEPLEPKPRMKVEYVKCGFNHKWEAVKFLEESDLDCLYWLNGSDESDINAFIQVFTPHQSIKQMAKGKELYRKVETEIKTEKRWIFYTKTKVTSPQGFFKSEDEARSHARRFSNPNADHAFQEITVEV